MASKFLNDSFRVLLGASKVLSSTAKNSYHGIEENLNIFIRSNFDPDKFKHFCNTTKYITCNNIFYTKNSDVQPDASKNIENSEHLKNMFYNNNNRNKKNKNYISDNVKTQTEIVTKEKKNDFKSKPLNKKTLIKLQKRSKSTIENDININKENKLHEKKILHEKNVPSSKVERALHFISLAASITYGTITEGISKTLSNEPVTLKSSIITKSNMSRFVDTLCKMRGAALKVGQMISLQEEYLPKELQSVLSKVRDNANIIPKKQLIAILKKEYGENWENNFSEFQFTPIAAASIGQVHSGKLKNGNKVAIKIQYPNIGASIDSDLRNLKWFVDKFDVFPRGIYINEIIKAARVELNREIDYLSEAKKQIQMKKLLTNEPTIHIPNMFLEYTTKHILVNELISGTPIDKVGHLPQEERNKIATTLLDITLKELFKFRFMQTDPNWSNFLYNEKTKIINLIDFGAAREYKKEFTDHYLLMVYACMKKNEKFIFKHSDFLSFTTGDETKRLKELHIKSAFVLGEPFRVKRYDFRNDKIVKDLALLGSKLMGDRLTPPPSEAYTLHRKLSGCFLSCIKLKAVVNCRDMFLKRYEEYDWDESCQRDVY